MQCALRSPADTSCRYVAQGLTYAAQDASKLRRHVECVEDSEALRQALASHGLVAFVGNGAILPRYLDLHKLLWRCTVLNHALD
jgi:predicted ABC-class ATPase